jgi:NTE family protein
MSFERAGVAPVQPFVLPYDQTVLVLQGGGALGAYQAGVYEVLHAHGIEPDWIAGISIGAINSAIIAGNAPKDRVAQLKSFWKSVGLHIPGEDFAGRTPISDVTYRSLGSSIAAGSGVPGFFRPWFLSPWFYPPGQVEATSFYDTSPLRQTLLDHIDFDRINAGATRLSLGAVNIRTGNFVYFDNRERAIGPEHVMASGALPPGFPAVVIDGEPYWDGGLVSNTPLSYVLDQGVATDTLVFQIDLFSAVGPEPRTMDEVEERRKDITYSSRTRMNTDAFLEKYRLRHLIRNLADNVPEDVRKRILGDAYADDTFKGRVSLVHLINRANRHEIQSKDFDFWRVSIEQHWQDGMKDAGTAMQAESWRTLSDPETGLAVYDYIRPDKVAV